MYSVEKEFWFNVIGKHIASFGGCFYNKYEEMGSSWGLTCTFHLQSSPDSGRERKTKKWKQW